MESFKVDWSILEEEPGIKCSKKNGFSIGSLGKLLLEMPRRLTNSI